MSSGNQPDPPASSVCSLNQLTNNVTTQYRSSVFVESDASFVSATPNVMYGTGESAVGLNSGSQHTSMAVDTVHEASSMGGPILSTAPSVDLSSMRVVEEPSSAPPEPKRRKKSPSSNKQIQLPMFLTSK